jgi:hypothetical protein
MLRIVAGGIFISNNGGESWTTGISANGLNASCITAGSINAEKINITMGTDVAFRWDRLGISAYKKDITGFSPDTFTRFDQYGIYGINNQDLGIADNESREDAMTKIKQKASFGLMWDDFWLKSSKNDGYVSISSDKDF